MRPRSVPPKNPPSAQRLEVMPLPGCSDRALPVVTAASGLPSPDSESPSASVTNHNTPHTPASYGRVRCRGRRHGRRRPGSASSSRAARATAAVRVAGVGGSESGPLEIGGTGRHGRAAWATRVRRSELPRVTSTLRHVLASQLELEPLAPGHRRAALLAAAGQGRQGCPRLGARHFGRGASPLVY